MQKFQNKTEKSDNRCITNANIEPQILSLTSKKIKNKKKICVKMSCKKFSKYLPSFRS